MHAQSLLSVSRTVVAAPYVMLPRDFRGGFSGASMARPAASKRREIHRPSRRIMPLSSADTMTKTPSARFSPVRATAGGSEQPCLPADPEDHHAIHGEKALWRAVIVQALMDAACGSRKPEAQQWKHDALIWLRGTSRDFFTVAYYAGFEPEYLRSMIAKALDGNCQWRALPGEGARKRPHRPKSERGARHRR